MPTFQTIDYLKEGPVAWIWLNRPRVRNAYNTAMRDELYQVLEAIRDDPEVSAAVLIGRGPSFCAGADLTEFGTAPSQVIARQVRWQRDVWGLFLSCPKPLVAAIHGHCIGSGIEMALLCDIRVAAESASFAMPEVSLGLSPAAGGTQTLPRSIGLGRSLDLLLAGRRLDAAEALQQGLVARVVPNSDLIDEARRLADALSRLDPALVRLAKRAVRQGAELSLSQGLGLEQRLVLQLGAVTHGGRGL